MSTGIPTKIEFDLNPHPRILPMLGEINLDYWRCMAELVDNSIDGFLKANRSGEQIQTPVVRINLPMKDDESAVITISDNGPGMSPDTLENAVKAGWTSNDPINNLGLFGMGFNIATAKLGRMTTVWTTRKSDKEWTGVKIDFDELEKQKHYRTERLFRPKADPEEGGTEVRIEKIKPELRVWFAKSTNRSSLSKKLSETYSSMLRPKGTPICFELYVNTTKAKGYEHCVWGGVEDGSQNRTVTIPKLGEVNALQLVDVKLQNRPFCQSCWQWLNLQEEKCPSCGDLGKVTQRQRRIYGWIGVQRYVDETAYGIDLLRNGRKIEIATKELFNWVDDVGTTLEYPIDDQRRRGRIVGEIHVDHCRVHYTKDRFDRTDPAWDEMKTVVRGEGPLRPDVAAEKGYGLNVSPLFKLYQAFRRSSPHKRTPGCYEKILLVPIEQNQRAKEFAEKFREGLPEYRSDEKWWELVQEGDRALLSGEKNTNPTGGNLDSQDPTSTASPLPGFVGGISGVPSNLEEPKPPPPPKRELVASLSGDYREEVTGQCWKIEALSAMESDPELQPKGKKPWAFIGDPSGTFRFIFNQAHSVFRSTTMTPLDALLAEISYTAMNFTRGISTSFSEVFSGLREKYGKRHSLEPADLSSEANDLLIEVARKVSEGLEESDRQSVYQELTMAEKESILTAMVTRGILDQDKFVQSGKFLEFIPNRTLLRMFDQHPEFFFDGRCWDDPFVKLQYSSAAAIDEARSQLVRRYSGLLMDAVWLAECDEAGLAEASRSKLVRASTAISLLYPTE